MLKGFCNNKDIDFSSFLNDFYKIKKGLEKLISRLESLISTFDNV